MRNPKTKAEARKAAEKAEKNAAGWAAWVKGPTPKEFVKGECVLKADKCRAEATRLRQLEATLPE